MSCHRLAVTRLLVKGNLVRTDRARVGRPLAGGAPGHLRAAVRLVGCASRPSRSNSGGALGYLADDQRRPDRAAYVRCARDTGWYDGRPPIVRDGSPSFAGSSAVRALLAQLVEHFHGKEGVVGSSPTEGSRKVPAYGQFFVMVVMCLCWDLATDSSFSRFCGQIRRDRSAYRVRTDLPADQDCVEP